MPASTFIADRLHISRMGSQGIRPVAVNDMTFGVDIVPVKIGRPDNRLTMFERIGALVVGLP